MTKLTEQFIRDHVGHYFRDRGGKAAELLSVRDDKCIFWFKGLKGQGGSYSWPTFKVQESYTYIGPTPYGPKVTIKETNNLLELDQHALDLIAREILNRIRGTLATGLGKDILSCCPVDLLLKPEVEERLRKVGDE
jgi:hypothetical protein